MNPIFDHDEPATIIGHIIKGQFNTILSKMYRVQNEHMFVNHLYFKHLATAETYPIILNYAVSGIEATLESHDQFIAHINLKHLTMSDFDKHKQFLKNVSVLLKQAYPDKLQKCYIYNAPTFFSYVYNFVSMFVDKETLEKIQLIS